MPSARASILVVEDDTGLRGVFRQALTAAGFDVREAADGIEALRRIDAKLPNLIVLDLGLPGVDGRDVLVELARLPQTFAIPVVVVTGQAHVADVRASCVACKPVSPDELVEIVSRCLGNAGTPGGVP
jgi:CheY-like chemotaxis protein